MHKLFPILFSIFIFSSCSHHVWRTYKKKETTSENDCGISLVRIHPPDSIAEKVGEIIMDDLGVSVNCSEEETINYLKKEACSLNAQVILIKQIKRPDIDSYCYRCTGIIYRMRPGASPVATKKYFEQERIEKRDQKDTKKKISRTIKLIGVLKYWIHFFSHI